ncbi:hypothetical protein PMAYCL1PPCAC_27086 [Pristionchus mayeri]|uniref:G protein-coupled receptor n=1 Tax=Pristionchus mayeri TaxID=1317129 RepID=A0AAN5D5R6_9BILA|nr:hypothetical protein PMAYCL1PPCAC_27086 [Pristionchus mayeri]
MDTDCALVEELYDYVPFHIVQWLMMFVSLASLILICYASCRYLHRTIFENITKELIFALYLYIGLYSVLLFVVHVSYLTYRYTAKDKCDAQFPRPWCILRFCHAMLAVSFIVVHVGITAQHLLSTFHFRSRSQKIVARIAIVISFVYPAVFGTITYWNEPMQGRTAYCYGVTGGSVNLLMANLGVILALHIINISTSILLLKYNHDSLRTDQSFDLVRSFHRRQNLYAMQQFLPISAVFAVVFLIFCGNYYFFKNNQEFKKKYGDLCALTK